MTDQEGPSWQHLLFWEDSASLGRHWHWPWKSGCAGWRSVWISQFKIKKRHAFSKIIFIIFSSSFQRDVEDENKLPLLKAHSVQVLNLFFYFVTWLQSKWYFNHFQDSFFSQDFRLNQITFWMFPDFWSLRWRGGGGVMPRTSPRRLFLYLLCLVRWALSSYVSW